MSQAFSNSVIEAAAAECYRAQEAYEAAFRPLSNGGGDLTRDKLVSMTRRANASDLGMIKKLLSKGSDGSTICESGPRSSPTGYSKVSLQQTFKGHAHYVNSVAFSPDGRFLGSGSYDNTIRIQELATAFPQTLRGHTGCVNSVAFSPDGQSLASGSYDYTVKIWEVATGSLQQTLQGHTPYVTSVDFSPDGRSLASGSDDFTSVLCQHIMSHQVLGSFRLRQEPDPLAAFSRHIFFIFINPRNAEASANIAVGVLKAGSINGRNPEDTTVRVRVADAEGRLERYLRLTYSSEAFEGRSLTAVLVCTGRNPLKKPGENFSPSDEVLVAFKWDESVTNVIVSHVPGTSSANSLRPCLHQL
ncbi:hypothetical protein DL763_010573 [Monosporascus cannonballus]|nr:hypothetical protein DL763_010573 [Monosporascus cannonballus]